MQLTKPKGNFIEKIIRDKNGKLVRATFCVYERNGRVRAHLLSAVFIDENISIENKTPALSGVNTTKTFETKAVYDFNVVSPYFNSDLLYSLGSKPRAPTF